MHKALQKIELFLGEYAVQSWLKRLERFQKMPGAHQTFKRIGAVQDIEQLEDYLAEVRYALVFAALGFQVEIEPLGRKGPDLRVSRDDHDVFVEIMRFRKIYPGPPLFDLSDKSSISPEYGDIPRDIRKAFEKILKKFSQVGNDESIIAIWNDDEDMEELEVNTAVMNIRRDAVENRLSIPDGLLFVLYGSKWIGGQENRQLYCFPFRFLLQPCQINLQRELDSATLEGLIQLALK